MPPNKEWKKTRDKAWFKLRHKLFAKLFSHVKKLFYSALGMKTGNTVIPGRIRVTWPHQVEIGNDCKLEHNIYFKYDGMWSSGPSIIIQDRAFIGSYVEFNINSSIQIGKDCLIASGCRFVDHDHGFFDVNKPMNNHPGGRKSPIVLEQNVWLGFGVQVMRGVHIGEGSIVAAGSVVINSIPAFEIWGGVPAKKIGDRRLTAD